MTDKERDEQQRRDHRDIMFIKVLIVCIAAITAFYLRNIYIILDAQVNFNEHVVAVIQRLAGK